MSIKIQIPRALERYTNGANEIDVESTTILEAINVVKLEQPALYRCLFDETGRIRRHINLFLNEQLVVADKEGLLTPVKDGDVVAVFQAVSGG